MTSKLLMDLSLAKLGFAGIPQDTRWLFKVLSELDGIESSGLIYGLQMQGLNYRIRNPSRKHRILRDALYFARLLEPEPCNRFALLRVLRRFTRAYAVYLKSTFRLGLLTRGEFDELIFRQFFEKGHSGRDREFVFGRDYFVCGLPHELMIRRLTFPVPLRQPMLDTRGFDYLVHQDSRPIRCFPGTTKIIRYHDIIPLIKPDLTKAASSFSKYHYLAIQECIKQGAIYVCNSEPTREDLVRIFPILEESSYTVPYSISEIYRREDNYHYLLSLLEFRASRALGDQARNGMISTVRAYSGAEDKTFANKLRYVLGVATIEPRKNYANLVRAFNVVRSEMGSDDLKLIICGELGWKNKEVVRMMKTQALSGHIVFLEDVHPTELRLLFSHAEVFVFPSFYEGFGLPPVEAMKCGCPVISSDIKVHRWTQGDAALYTDPYDHEDIADKILQVVRKGRGSEFVDDLINKGYRQAARYSTEKVKDQWREFFDDLQASKITSTRHS